MTRRERRTALFPIRETWPRKREYLWAAIAAALMLAYASGWAEQTGRDATAGMVAETDAHASAHVAQRLAWHWKALAAHRTGQLARCMGASKELRAVIVWENPHTGEWMGTFCETHVLHNGELRK